VRSVAGVIYCEQCLAAKLGISGAPSGYSAPGAGYTTVDQGGYTASGAPAGNVNFAAAGVIPPINAGPNPGTATILGFIPGVGAMYNGQFVKALVHVLVFVILIGITDNHGIFGIFIAAWIAYQVFDAHQTAKARRDGLPLPDPFGLNELGAKIGISNATVTPPFTQTYTTTAVPPVPPTAAAGFTDPYAAYNAPYTEVPPVGGVPPYNPVPPGVDPNAPIRRREPIGAIVLIGLGLLFLFNTIGFFRFDWIGHFWPLFIIALGAWLLIRRTGADIRFGGRVGKPHDNNVPPPPPAGGGQ
jgi:TM2 domain-containing membrane protein YozV